ncbi:hypothetical protein ACFW89_10400 [Streptomyces albidoflavus]
MTVYDSVEMVREQMWVERPAGTHLSNSSVPGGLSALVRDDNNALTTQAVLYPYPADASSEEVPKMLLAGVFVAGVAATALVARAAPQVKSKFRSLKAKMISSSASGAESEGKPVN